MTWRSSSPPSSSSWWQNFVTAAVHVKIPSTADVAGLAGGIAVSTPPTAATTSTSASGIHGASSGGGGGGGSSVPSRVIYPFESVSLGNTDSDPLLSGIHPIREADETGGAGKAGGGRGLWRGRDGEDREKEGRDGEAHDDAQGEAQDDAQGEAQDEAQGEAQTWASNRQISQGAGEVAGERASSSAQHLSESMLPHHPSPRAHPLSLPPRPHPPRHRRVHWLGHLRRDRCRPRDWPAHPCRYPFSWPAWRRSSTRSAMPTLPPASPAAWAAIPLRARLPGQLASFVLFCHLVLDYHVGAAAIARSLASYLASLVEVASGVGLPAVLAPGGLPISIPLPFLSPLGSSVGVPTGGPGDKSLGCHPY
ncbi:hypothetical protein CLOM_g19249 [Closterium sp. NIES-68]|nr:hypothetical protein CLOM_g19249 [Closterium sp. NIES-68]